MKVYLPEWAKQGCKVIETWDEEVISGTAKGIGTFVKYTNPKGSEIVRMKWVKWCSTSKT